MPIYEYQCEECGHELEALQKMSDNPLTDCPACGKPELRKLVSASAFRLKGGGWYETDFKTQNQKNLEKGDKGKVDTGEAKSAGEAGNANAAQSSEPSSSASSSDHKAPVKPSGNNTADSSSVSKSAASKSASNESSQSKSSKSDG